ncbi:HpcH/HpaI aldolase family protein [Alterinioella nitratireducens]|uniref:HpcH/HpaI aldolase family protein n=1 Tax=Alterinioella nitratireducens TaxID=2735915 RepID=UPI001555E4B9|nr:HpcH/HpaI aldolase/citrate lyase family protein [Alterinioella nitratireducens]NPD17906.1 HpcH/HpaI aldolase/citrate lyase family protein [Alterinioella nitratireducens]
MNLPANPFARALKSRDKQIGLWISLASNIAAEVTAHAGFDWALIDMEHSPNDYRSVLGQLQVFAGSQTTALVRVEWNDTVAVKKLLDIGAQGLLFPMIQSVEEARRAVAATRYPPKGARGVSGTTRATRYGRVKDYLARVEEETAILLQVETQAALDAAEDIAAVDGVDGIFFGPADIGADMGLLGNPMHPDIWARIRPVAKALMARGMPVGTLVTDPGFAAELMDEGFTFVACGLDTGLLARASDKLLADVKAHM